MKCFALIPICALAVLATACERHPASELPPDHGAGAQHAEAGSPAVPEARPTEPAGESKPAPARPEGEAPKFFPENK